MLNNKKVVVVLPAYNAARTLRRTVDEIPSEIVDEVIRLHPLGVEVLFNFSAGPDAKNSTQNIADADQGGLGLPDRDYYLKDDPKSVKLREQYLGHVQKMLELLGESPTSRSANRRAFCLVAVLSRVRLCTGA